MPESLDLIEYSFDLESMDAEMACQHADNAFRSLEMLLYIQEQLKDETFALTDDVIASLQSSPMLKAIAHDREKLLTINTEAATVWVMAAIAAAVVALIVVFRKLVKYVATEMGKMVVDKIKGNLDPISNPDKIITMLKELRQEQRAELEKLWRGEMGLEVVSYASVRKVLSTIQVDADELSAIQNIFTSVSEQDLITKAVQLTADLNSKIPLYVKDYKFPSNLVVGRSDWTVETFTEALYTLRSAQNHLKVLLYASKDMDTVFDKVEKLAGDPTLAQGDSVNMQALLKGLQAYKAEYTRIHTPILRMKKTMEWFIFSTRGFYAKTREGAQSATA